MPNCGTCPVYSQKSIQFHPDTFGKPFKFLIQSVPGHTGSGSVQVHKWDRKPNSGFNGRIFHKLIVPGFQGILSFEFSPSPDFVWLSFFQRNPANSGNWDCCCVSVNNILQVVNLVGF
jgi:hypothetical protein